MSSDNYYIVGPHPDGGYGVAMGFMSEWDTSEEDPKITSTSPRFDTEDAAWDYAINEPAEYGVFKVLDESVDTTEA